MGGNEITPKDLATKAWYAALEPGMREWDSIAAIEQYTSQAMALGRATGEARIARLEAALQHIAIKGEQDEATRGVAAIMETIRELGMMARAALEGRDG